MVTEISMEYMKSGQLEPDDIMRVVMFYGSTCGPCKATMPNYEAVADFYTNNGTSILFYKINAWEPIEQRDYVNETWAIKGVPHFKVFCKGEVIMTKEGGGDEPTMKQFIVDAVDAAFKQLGVRI